MPLGLKRAALGSGCWNGLGIGLLDQNTEKGLGSPDLVGAQLLGSFRIDSALNLANEGCGTEILDWNLTEFILELIANRLDGVWHGIFLVEVELKTSTRLTSF